jgi:hypothetical protein
MRDLNATIAREARFRRHLRRYQPVLQRLRASGRSDPNVLAIVAVESFYRPRLLRAVEYVLWALISVVAERPAGRISVGVAQLKLANWVETGMIDGTRFSLPRLRRVRDPEMNFDACRRFLSARGALGETDPASLSRAYAGGERPHFAAMLDQALESRSGPAGVAVP